MEKLYYRRKYSLVLGEIRHRVVEGSMVIAASVLTKPLRHLGQAEKLLRLLMLETSSASQGAALTPISKSDS